jgi:hypothetical protein
MDLQHEAITAAHGANGLILGAGKALQFFALSHDLSQKSGSLLEPV